MRTISQEEYCHERLGENFAGSLSQYDTQRRVEVLVDSFLLPRNPEGKQVLDVGCGLGYFSKRLVELGADVLACDIGENLLAKTQELAGCRTVQADALSLTEKFGPETFDIVISSECVEHTPDPLAAVAEMAGVLKTGGLLALSTPNIVWHPVVKAATKLKLRPFDGHENFSSWKGLREQLARHNVKILEERGLHLFPFQFRMHRLSRWFDQHAQSLRGFMINICLLGEKT